MNAPDMLNLLFLRVVNVNDTESPNDYYITAESTYNDIIFCPNCSETSTNKIVKFGKRNFFYMDTPTHGRRVGIRVNRQRYQCRSCNTTFFEPMLDMDDSHNATKRLVSYIREESLNRTFVSISNDTGLSQKTVRNIFHEYVEELERKYQRIMPEWMGFDEIHLLGKRRFVITNIKERTMVDMLRDNSLPTVENYFLRFKGPLTRAKYITMDMYSPYKTIARKLFPDAKVVVDKYHILSMASHAMDRTRIDIRSSLDPGMRKRLMRSKWLLHRRAELTPVQQETLNSWLEAFPKLYEAYCLKEFFYEIWDSETREEAEHHFREWQRLVTDDYPLFKALAKTVNNWYDEIFNYFGHPVTNAFTESLNSIIRLTDRSGRGYSFEAIRAKILFTRNIQKVATPKFQKNKFKSGEINYAMGSYGSNEPLESFGTDISTLSKLLATGEFWD